ncbi:UNVERIFIED_CONTAM: Protein BEARSKIN1 [Sesamum indicum]
MSCMSSSALNMMGNMNAVVQEEYPALSIMNCLPVGYRFQPTDTELILHYLKRKVNNQPLPCTLIHTVDVYEFRPEDLCDMLGENERYLFCPRKRRSSSGTRANRTTPYGYWKATIGDRAIRHNGKEVAYRKTLVYYMNGESSNTTSRKTDWIMHEYRLKNHSDAPDRLWDDIVLCRIHNHKSKKYRSNHEDGATNESDQWNQPNPIQAIEDEDVDVNHQQQQQTLSASFEDSCHSTKQGCSDQCKSSSNDLFDGFNELMDKGMEFLDEVMSMDFLISQKVYVYIGQKDCIFSIEIGVLQSTCRAFLSFN